jgi:AraC-like DNA-binding protein
MQIPDTKVENPNIVHAGSTHCLVGLPEIVGMGFVRESSLHPDRVLDFWVLGLLTRGTMDLRVSGERAVLSAENYYLLPPQVHHYGMKSPAGEEFDVIYFHFLLNTTHLSTQTALLPTFGRIPPEISYLNLYRFIKRAVDFALLSPAQVDLQIAALLAQLSVMQGYSLSEDERAKRLAYRVMDYLREWIEHDVSREQIAAALGYSYGHLDRVFRQQFGTNIHQRLLQLRIETAAELLTMGRSIKEVAARVGFHDYRYFLKVFKKMRGVTPGRLQRGPGIS